MTLAVRVMVFIPGALTWVCTGNGPLGRVMFPKRWSGEAMWSPMWLSPPWWKNRLMACTVDTAVKFEWCIWMYLIYVNFIHVFNIFEICKLFSWTLLSMLKLDITLSVYVCCFWGPKPSCQFENVRQRNCNFQHEINMLFLQWTGPAGIKRSLELGNKKRAMMTFFSMRTCEAP